MVVLTYVDLAISGVGDTGKGVGVTIILDEVNDGRLMVLHVHRKEVGIRSCALCMCWYVLVEAGRIRRSLREEVLWRHGACPEC